MRNLPSNHTAHSTNSSVYLQRFSAPPQERLRQFPHLNHTTQHNKLRLGILRERGPGHVNTSQPISSTTRTGLTKLSNEPMTTLSPPNPPIPHPPPPNTTPHASPLYSTSPTSVARPSHRSLAPTVIALHAVSQPHRASAAVGLLQCLPQIVPGSAFSPLR
jgi:hypothetical protein